MSPPSICQPPPRVAASPSESHDCAINGVDKRTPTENIAAMNRRTFVLLSGAVSGSLRVPLRASARGAETPEAATGRLYFEFDNRHRWSLWYRGEGPAVPVLPFTSAGVHLGETTGRILTLEDPDDVSL